MSSAAVANVDLARFSREIAALDMKPLWERVMRLKPGTAARPRSGAGARCGRSSCVPAS